MTPAPQLNPSIHPAINNNHHVEETRPDQTSQAGRLKASSGCVDAIIGWIIVLVRQAGRQAGR